MTISQARDYCIKHLERLGNMAHREADWLIESVLKCDKAFLLAYPNKELSEEEWKKILDFSRRRQNGEPLQYILESEIFMGLDFIVSKDVLIPRADTEILVEAICEQAKHLDFPRVLDIGTGSGAIAVSLAHFIKNAQIFAVDISEEALQVAKKNANAHGVLKRIVFKQSNLFEVCQKEDLGPFDFIVSNPPYIPTKDIESLQIEISYEPLLALDGGEDGYDLYKKIIQQAGKFLVSGGLLAMETGYDQANQVADMMKGTKGFSQVEILKDTQKIPRVVCGRWGKI